MKEPIFTHTELSDLIDDVIARTPHAWRIHGTVGHMHAYVSSVLDFTKDEVWWFYRRGLPSRSVWVTHRGQTHYFLYNQRTGEISMRKENRQGCEQGSFGPDEEPHDIQEKLAVYFY